MEIRTLNTEFQQTDEQNLISGIAIRFNSVVHPEDAVETVPRFFVISYEKSSAIVFLKKWSNYRNYNMSFYYMH